MIKLIIFKKDGSIYWQETFNIMSDAKTWLTSEMTRPYWDKTYTYTFTDNTKQILADQAAAKAQQDTANAIRAQAVSDIKTMIANPQMTTLDIGSTLNKIVQILGL